MGIDYGKKNLGISIAATPLAEPLTILDNNASSIHAIRLLCRQHRIDKIIIGVSEGTMAKNSRAFGSQLQTIGLPVEFHDETLTSYEANLKLRHTKKSVRSEPQDAYQATLILQDYLDTRKSAE